LTSTRLEPLNRFKYGEDIGYTMTSKTHIIIGIVAFLAIAGTFIFVNYSKPEFPEITRCIMGVEVDYNSNMKVDSLSDVEVVFNKFAVYTYENNKSDIYGDVNFVGNWLFEKATIDGVYDGKKYWTVVAYRCEGKPGTNYTCPPGADCENPCLGRDSFDVSEDGEVVRLLGCI